MAGMGYGFIHTLNTLINVCDELLLLLVGCVLLYAAYRLRVLADEAEGGKLKLAWMGTAALALALLLVPLMMLFMKVVNWIMVRAGFWDVLDFAWLLTNLVALCFTLLALVGAGMLAAGLGRDRS